MRDHTRLSLVCMILALGFFACSSESGKGEESPDPEMGSADSWASPTLHGEVNFGGSKPAEFDGEAFYHAWDFELTGIADVTVQVDGPSDHFDTVMYLYQREPGAENWGRYIERNDDYDGNLWSRLDVNLVAAEYRVVVKGYKRNLRGAFSLTASCTGDGCHSTPHDCDDNNQCTVDVWDSFHGICVHLPKNCSDGDSCTHDSCEAASGQCHNESIPGCGEGECLFETDYQIVDDRGGCANSAQAQALSDLMKHQIVQGGSQLFGEVLTLEQVLDDNDDGEVCWGGLRDANGWPYLRYGYYLGDTEVGFFYADGDAMLAYIGDSDIYDCTVTGLEGECLFGETEFALGYNPDFTLLAERDVTLQNLVEISDIRKQQILAGMARHHGESITLEQAIEWTDEGAVRMRDFATPNLRKFVVYDFGAGDNGFGFLYALADEVQAEISDGDVMDCLPGGDLKAVCLFGETYYEPHMRLIEQDSLEINNGNVGQLSTVRKAQLMAGAQVDFWTGETPEEVVANTDDGEVAMSDFGSSSGRHFVSYTTHLGDAFVGFIMAEGDTLVATIEGQEYLSCQVRAPNGDCLLGDYIYDSEDYLPGFTCTKETFYWGDYQQIPGVKKAQIEDGWRQMFGTEKSLEDIFAFIEDGEMEIWNIQGPRQRNFTQFTFWDGMDQMGFVMREAGVVLAQVSDGEIADCLVMVTE